MKITVLHMIRHHEGAVVMVEYVGIDQQVEIAVMKRQLRRLG